MYALSSGAVLTVVMDRSTVANNGVTEGTNSVYLNRTSNGAPSASIGLQ